MKDGGGPWVRAAAREEYSVARRQHVEKEEDAVVKPINNKSKETKDVKILLHINF